MNAAVQSAPGALTIGMFIHGGYFAGIINAAGQQRGIVVSPKAFGEISDIAWHEKYESVEGAKSFFDGLSNTVAMSEAGSPLAQQILDLPYDVVEGVTPWYLPALDEQEICFRAFNPTADDNSGWARSGMNLSAVPPTWPYSHQPASHTSVEAFRAGRPEAYELESYWTSTQHASDSDYAWRQDFLDGYQDSWDKLIKLRGRAVRSFLLTI